MSGTAKILIIVGSRNLTLNFSQNRVSNSRDIVVVVAAVYVFVVVVYVFVVLIDDVVVIGSVIDEILLFLSL